MVSRTRIPTSMYPDDYTPSTPSGVVTPASITKDGSGEPLIKKMYEDFACGDEPGHAFRSSPLNIYALARDSSVVLYVEGGCANFTWASDNEWATFGTAETAVRYNTLTSSADEGQDTVVTVTDGNSLEVTINVPYMDASSCCEDVPIALSIQTAKGTVKVGKELVVFLDGGCPSFSWSVDDAEFTLDYASTNSRRDRVVASVDAETATLTVEDSCGATDTLSLCACGAVTFTYDDESSDETVEPNTTADIYITGGCPPFSWSVSGTDFSLSNATTDNRTNTLIAGDSSCGSATITVVDDCGDSVTGYVRSTIGEWSSIGNICQLEGAGDETPLGVGGGCVARFYYELIEGKYKQTQVTCASASCSEPGSCPLPGHYGCPYVICPANNDVDCPDGYANCIDQNHSSGLAAGYDCHNDGGYCVCSCLCVQSLEAFEWGCPA